MQRSIRNLFGLPSLISLKVTRSTFPSATDLLVDIFSAASVKNLYLSHLDFEADVYSPSDGGALISPTTTHLPNPRSVTLTSLHLELSTDLMTFVSYFNAQRCPFSFEFLNSLALIRPRGNPQPFDTLFDPPSDIGHDSLATSLQSIGHKVRNLSLGYSLQGEDSERHPVVRFY